MPEPLALHLVMKADLASRRSPAPWQDPYRLMLMPPGKRRALLSNPLSDNERDPVRIIATQEGVVAGRLDVIVGQIRVAGSPVRCLWTSDLFVPEEFRNTLAGVKLMLRLQSLNHTVGACGVSQPAYQLFRGLRWADVPMSRFVLLRRSRPIVDRYLGAGVASRVSRVAIDVAFRAHGTLVAAWSALRRRGSRYEKVDAMSPELDPRLAADDTAVGAHRSAAWINWLLRNSFYEALPVVPALYYVYDRRGRIVGYFLTKATTYPSHQGFKDVIVGSLKDWMIFDRDALSLTELVACAVQALLRWDVEAIEVCLPATTAPHLQSLGFVRRGTLHLFLKGSTESPLGRVEIGNGPIGLRPAEGDNFFS
jgi:hypothetical protein